MFLKFCYSAALLLDLFFQKTYTILHMNQIQLPETYAALSDFRKNDVYLPEMDQEQLISDFFPEHLQSLSSASQTLQALFTEGCSNRPGSCTEQKL